MNNKRAALAAIAADVLQAAPQGRSIVLGEGNSDATLAIVGEAPGKEEELQGHPFVGRAGQLLDQLLEEVGLDRRELWVTNVVKWRPTTSGGGKDRTRTPRIDEIGLHGKWLQREFAVVGPDLVLCLGAIAARVVIARHLQLNIEHGRWHRAVNGSSALATFHPAFALRRGGAFGAIGRSMSLDFRLAKEAYDRKTARLAYALPAN